MAVNETVTGNNAVAIKGTATGSGETTGVHGVADAVGVRGDGKNWHGVAGLSDSSTGGSGVFGANRRGNGVTGESEARFNAGVAGVHKGSEGWGVRGEAENGAGTGGLSGNWHGVYGESRSSSGGAGVWGEHKSNGAGVVGVSNGSGPALYGESRGTGPAASFNGTVDLAGILRVNGRMVRLLTDQQHGSMYAYSPPEDEAIVPQLHLTTVQVAHRHITARVGVSHLTISEDFDEYATFNVSIHEIVSESGVERPDFAERNVIERLGVTSVTFNIEVLRCWVQGFWSIDYWA